MAYWVFFPEFRSILAKQETNQVKETGSYMDVLRLKRPELFDYDILSNSFFMLITSLVKGFAFNKEGKINCSVFFDENGIIHGPAVLDLETQECHVGQVEIKKEDLLIKASSVRLIEQIAPEITRADCHSNQAPPFPAVTEFPGKNPRTQMRAEQKKREPTL